MHTQIGPGSGSLALGAHSSKASFNLSDLLARSELRPEAKPELSKSKHSVAGVGFIESGGSSTGSSVSLAQLMSKHEQECQAKPTDGLPCSLASLSLGPSAPGSAAPSTTRLPPGLSLGPNAPGSLHSSTHPPPGLSLSSTVPGLSLTSTAPGPPLGAGMTSAPLVPGAPGLSLGSLSSLSSTPSLLSSSLSGLRLEDPKASAAVPVPLGSLSSVLQGSRPLQADGGLAGAHVGSPSLASLIQEHQSSSPKLYSTLPGLQSTHADMLTHTHIQPHTQPAHMLGLQGSSLSSLSSTQTGSGGGGCGSVGAVDPPSLLGAPSLSELMSQHQAKSSPPLASCSLASLIGASEPNSSEKTEPKTQKTTQMQPQRPPPCTPKPRPSPASAQTVDLSALMAQMSPSSNDGRGSPFSSLSYPSSPLTNNSPSQGKRPSLLARPSTFALALSTRSPGRIDSRHRRAKILGCHQAFLYSRQIQCLENPEPKELEPLHHIAPFLFDTPSPDDIVRANQKKAFTRD